MDIKRNNRAVGCGLAACIVALLMGCATRPPLEVTEWGTHPAEARAAYASATNYLDRGRQADAEMLMADAVTDHADSQRILFLSALLARSRFDITKAEERFTEAAHLDPRSVLGQAGRMAASIDQDEKVEKNLRQLASLLEQHPDEILIRWLYVIEAVAGGLDMQGAIDQCGLIFDRWQIGPVTLHQAYASLLTSRGDRLEEALEHRQLAADLEPGPATYEGLALTLEAMERYEDAEAIYAKVVELVPDRAIHWFQWGNCLAYLGDFANAADKFEEAFALDGQEVISLLCWGRCLERLGRPVEGFDKYREAMQVTREMDELSKAYVAHAKLYGYGTACSFEEALELSALQGASAIDTLRERIRMVDESSNPLAPEHSSILMEHLAGLAEDGDPEAAYSLAMIYRHGIGVDKDPVLSESWLQRAADNGHAIAQRMINPPL